MDPKSTQASEGNTKITGVNSRTVSLLRGGRQTEAWTYNPSEWTPTESHQLWDYYAEEQLILLTHKTSTSNFSSCWTVNPTEDGCLCGINRAG